jgi:hypothetical protein
MVAAAPTASAATSGNKVYNECASDNVVLAGGTSSITKLYACSWSSSGVQDFYVSCPARSQWGYWYSAGVWHRFTTNNNSLKLTVVC